MINTFYTLNITIMIKTVKLQNTLNRTYNGVRPQGTINVEEKDVPAYLAEGFAEVKEVIKEANKQAKADAKAQKEQDKADAEAQAEKDAQDAEQAKLDAEHAEQNGAGDNNGDGQDAVDLDAETQTKADEGSDANALNADLANTPVVKKNTSKKK